MSRSSVLRPSHQVRTKWKAIPAAPATRRATSLLTETFSRACTFRCRAAMCAGRIFLISGATLRSWRTCALSEQRICQSALLVLAQVVVPDVPVWRTWKAICAGLQAPIARSLSSVPVFLPPTCFVKTDWSQRHYWSRFSHSPRSCGSILFRQEFICHVEQKPPKTFHLAHLKLSTAICMRNYRLVRIAGFCSPAYA